MIHPTADNPARAATDGSFGFGTLESAEGFWRTRRRRGPAVEQAKQPQHNPPKRKPFLLEVVCRLFQLFHPQNLRASPKPVCWPALEQLARRLPRQRPTDGLFVELAVSAMP
jgi:hypothetical protein